MTRALGNDHLVKLATYGGCTLAVDQCSTPLTKVGNAMLFFPRIAQAFTHLDSLLL